MKLSEAIAIRQDENWQVKQAEEEAIRLAEIQREQDERQAKAVFLRWFYETTGIEEVEDTELFVQLQGNIIVWWKFNATGNQVRFNGDVIKLPDGVWQVFPARSFTTLGSSKEEPNWHAVSDSYYCDFQSFCDAAIYAMNLPHAKPRDNALLASESS